MAVEYPFGPSRGLSDGEVPFPDVYGEKTARRKGAAVMFGHVASDGDYMATK